MGKQITMYELLGLVKDDKAPKKIKYDNYIFEYDGIYYMTENNTYLDEYCDLSRVLNDEVEILEEEKKIPEKLNKNYYITQPDINNPSKVSRVSYDMEQLLEMVQDIYEKQGEICDYLNSKGE